MNSQNAQSVIAFPLPLPTCHPQALILPDRVHLNHHWLTHIPSYAGMMLWHALYGKPSSDAGREQLARN